MEFSNRDLSDRICFEDDDLKAEFIYQSIFRFHDVQLSCLQGIGEIFGMRRALSEVPGKPLENFVRECGRSAVCEIETAREDMLSVRLRHISLDYEPQKKCLAILPGQELFEKVQKGSGDRKIRLKTQRYWVSSLHFPPLAVFMEMENECWELEEQYDFLESWKNSEECRKAESVVRDMMAAFETVLSFSPQEWSDCLTFGFPQEGTISLSLSEELASMTGQRKEMFRLEGWRTGLHRLLGRRFEQRVAILQQRIDKELEYREMLEQRFSHNATQNEIAGLSVENRGNDAREQYYLNMVLCKAKGKTPKLQAGAFLNRFRFYVQGWRSSSKLVEYAEKCTEADTCVIRDEAGKATALHFHFDLFDAIYDFSVCNLIITLGGQIASEMPVEDTRFEYQMERMSTHFSVRSLCDCHYQLKESWTALTLVKKDIREAQEAYELRTEGLRTFLAMAGSMLVPINGEEPLYRMILYPLENSRLKLGLESCTGTFASVTMDIPLDGITSGMKLWWSRWKLSMIKASKLRELEMKQTLERYTRVQKDLRDFQKNTEGNYMQRHGCDNPI